MIILTSGLAFEPTFPNALLEKLHTKLLSKQSTSGYLYGVGSYEWNAEKDFFCIFDLDIDDVGDSISLTFRKLDSGYVALSSGVNVDPLHFGSINNLMNDEAFDTATEEYDFVSDAYYRKHREE